MYSNTDYTSPAFQQQWLEQIMTASSSTSSADTQSTPAPQQSPAAPGESSSNEWMIQWFDHSKKDSWRIGTPLFKYCKKRKEHYSEQFPDIWYKAPYKYHMLLEVEGMTETDNTLVLAELNYEDGQPVLYKTQPKKSKKAKAVEQPQLSSGVVSNNENYFVHCQKTKPEAPLKSEVTIGPFQFNICSYKQDGRKFRMVVYLYSPSSTPTDAQPQNRISLVCCLVSPPFTIRAKKPIVSPGIKKNKSAAKNEEDEELPQIPEKKRKPEEEATLQPEQKKQRTIPAPVVISKQLPSVPLAVISHPIQQQAVPQQPLPSNDEFLISLDAFTPASPVKIAEKPLSGAEKVSTIIALFKSMEDKDRKELLGQLMENTYAHEKEFVRRKFFESAPETQFLQPQQQTSHNQYLHQLQHLNMLGGMQSHYAAHATTGLHASADVDHFFLDLLN